MVIFIIFIFLLTFSRSPVMSNTVEKDAAEREGMY